MSTITQQVNGFVFIVLKGDPNAHNGLGIYDSNPALLICRLTTDGGRVLLNTNRSRSDAKP
jgi:hypothetical protein